MIFNQIEIPKEISIFEFRKTVDHEKTTAGLGYGLEFDTIGVKATIYIYDLNIDVPSSVDSDEVVLQFNNSCSNIYEVNSDVKSVVQPQKIKVSNLDWLVSAYTFNDSKNEQVVSFIYLTSLLGNFVKTRLTFSASNRVEDGDLLHKSFIVALSDILENQLPAA